MGSSYENARIRYRGLCASVVDATSQDDFNARVHACEVYRVAMDDMIGSAASTRIGMDADWLWMTDDEDAPHGACVGVPLLFDDVPEMREWLAKHPVED